MEIKAINYLQKDYINEEDFFCSAEVLIGPENEDFVYETYMFHVISIKRLYDNYQKIEDEGVMLNKGWIITKYYNEKAIANEIKLILERCESSDVQETYTKLDSYFIRE